MDILAQTFRYDEMLDCFKRENLDECDYNTMMKTFDIVSKNPHKDFFVYFFDKLTSDDLSDVFITFVEINQFFNSIIIFCVDNFEYDLVEHICENTEIFKLRYNEYHESLSYAYWKNSIEIVEIIINNLDIDLQKITDIIRDSILFERFSRLRILLNKSSANQRKLFAITAKTLNRKNSEVFISNLSQDNNEIIERMFELCRDECDEKLRLLDLNLNELSLADKKQILRSILFIHDNSI